MSQASSSSRGKNTYNVFNPNLDPDKYKAENLEKFILSAGTDEYRKFVVTMDAEKKRYLADAVSRAGVDPYKFDPNNAAILAGNQEYEQWRKQVAAIHQSVARTGDYRKTLQALRYNTVMELYNEGLLEDLSTITQSEAVSAGLGKEITKDAVTEYFDKNGADKLIEWVTSQSPLAFKANAIEQVARLLKVTGFSSIRGTGDDRKRRLYDHIMNGIGGSVGMGNRPTPVINRNNSLTQYLKSRNINYAGDLYALSVEGGLKPIAKAYNVPSLGTRKENFVTAIATAAGFPLIRDENEVVDEVNDIIAMIQSNPIEARRRAGQMDPNELQKVPLKIMRKLATDLGLRREFPQQATSKGGAPSRELIIKTLTGSSTSKSRADAEKKNIKTDMSYCSNADPMLVNSIANDMGIPTYGLTHIQLCDKIYTAHLAKVSELILRRGGDISRIASLPAEEQTKELKKLASALKLGSEIETLDDLLRSWLRTHYQARTGTLFPDRRADVDAYLADGTLPMSSVALRDLGTIFSDVRRDMHSMDDAQRRDALDALYSQFIARLNRGNGVAAFLVNLPKFNFSINTDGSPQRSPSTLSPRNARPGSNRTLPSPVSPRPGSNRASPVVSPQRASPPSSPRNARPGSNRLLPPAVSPRDEYNDLRSFSSSPRTSPRDDQLQQLFNVPFDL